MHRQASSKGKVFLGVAVLVVLLPIICCVCCPDTLTVMEWNYRYRVKTGMTLKQIEGILGPGKKVDHPPETAAGPVINGDEVFYWGHGEGVVVYVGIRDGRACEKWFGFPPLF